MHLISTGSHIAEKGHVLVGCDKFEFLMQSGLSTYCAYATYEVMTWAAVGCFGAAPMLALRWIFTEIGQKRLA
jgi:hypothetical protein